LPSMGSIAAGFYGEELVNSYNLPDFVTPDSIG